jgi:hypothetical protein
MDMKALAVCVLIFGSGVLFAQDTSSHKKLDLPRPAPLVISKSLPNKGTLVMEANVGEVKIVRSDEEKTIRLTIEPGAFLTNETVKSWVRRFDVAWDRASIDLKLPNHEENKHSTPSVTVSIPAQTDLKLELGVGELAVKGIEGNKDLHVGVGQLTVGVADGAKYDDIQTGSKIGEADDDISSQHSGGFFPRTHHTSTQGLYKLHATVGIGQVNVVQD